MEGSCRGFGGLPPEKVVRGGVDGCGVVVFGMPIANMAYAYARLADPGGALPECFRDPAQRMTSAMIEYPEMIGGLVRFRVQPHAKLRGHGFCQGLALRAFSV